MNEDGYVYESKRRPSTANSHLEKSNGTIDLKFWSTNSVHIDTTLRVRSSFHLIPSVHFISLNFIVSHRVFFFFLFFPLSLSLSYVHAVLYLYFSVSGRSIFLSPAFLFLTDALRSLSSFSIRLISPTFPATPHFLRNRSTFFVLFLSPSLSLSLSFQLPL